MSIPQIAPGARVRTMTGKTGRVLSTPEGERPIAVRVALDPIRTNFGHGPRRTVRVTAAYHPDDLVLL